MKLADENLLRDWLLHRLDESVATELEQRLLCDEDVAAELREAEQDLIDDYAQGRLDAADRGAVEHYLLSTPQDRQRLLIARALAQVAHVPFSLPLGSVAVAQNTPRRFHANRRRLLFAAALAASIVLSVLLVRAWSGRDVSNTPRAAAMPLPTLTLLASTTRSTSVDPLRVPRGDIAIRLQAEVDSAQALYVLSVADEKATLFTARDLQPHVSGPYVFVETTIPAHLFDRGPYRIRVALQQGTDSGAFTWSVE